MLLPRNQSNMLLQHVGQGYRANRHLLRHVQGGQNGAARDSGSWHAKPGSALAAKSHNGDVAIDMDGHANGQQNGEQNGAKLAWPRLDPTVLSTAPLRNQVLVAAALFTVSTSGGPSLASLSLFEVGSGPCMFRAACPGCPGDDAGVAEATATKENAGTGSSTIPFEQL